MKTLEFALASAKSDKIGASEKDEGTVGRQTFTGAEALPRLETKILRVKVELILREALFENERGLKPTTENEKKYKLLHLITQLTELSSSYAVLRVNSAPPNECIFEILEEENMQRRDDECINRLVFVAVKCVQASSSSSEELFEFLIQFAKDAEPRAGVTFRSKLRALRVVLRLSQMHQPLVASILLSKCQLTSSKSFFRDLVSYTRHYPHMVVFEEHRVPYSIAFLLKTDKDALVRSTLRQYSVHTSWIVHCASRLILDFNVQSADLWGTALSGMCPFLDQIGVTAFAIHLRDLREIAEGERDGEAILKSLYFCGFAVRCAMVIPKPITRFEALTKIIQADAYMPDLRELLDTCFLNGDHDEHFYMENEENEFAEQFHLVQGAFAEAMKRDRYKDLLDTSFEQGFIEFLAATGKIDRLAILIAKKRLEAASTAVELYFEFHPDARPLSDQIDHNTHSETTNEASWGRLKSYLSSSSSSDLEAFRSAL